MTTNLIARLRNDVCFFSQLDWQEHVALARAAAEALEEAELVIGPFANEADSYEPDEDDNYHDAWNSTFLIGELRAARDWQRKYGKQGQ